MTGEENKLLHGWYTARINTDKNYLVLAHNHKKEGIIQRRILSKFKLKKQIAIADGSRII